MERNKAFLLLVVALGLILVSFSFGESHGYDKGRALIPEGEVAFDADGNFFGPGEYAPEGAKDEHLNSVIGFPVGDWYMQVSVNLSPEDAKKIGPGYMQKLMDFNYTAATGGDVEKAIPAVSQFYGVENWYTSSCAEKL